MRIGDMGDCRIIMGSPLRRYEAVGGRAAKGSHRILLPSAISGGTINEKLVEIRPFFTEPSGDCFTNRYDVALELTAPFSAAFVPVGLEGLFVTSSLCLLRFRGDPMTRDLSPATSTSRRSLRSCEPRHREWPCRLSIDRRSRPSTCPRFRLVSRNALGQSLRRRRERLPYAVSSTSSSGRRSSRPMPRCLGRRDRWSPWTSEAC